MTAETDPQWYRRIWTLDLRDASWVESTVAEVDFVVEALSLPPGQRVLDLACGFGRHSLELVDPESPAIGVEGAERRRLLGGQPWAMA